MLTLESFEQAAEIVKQVTQETKLIKSSYFSDLTGNKVYLKPENMQRTGAYKVRGAYYKISTLTEEERAKGLIAASAGNHAQGVAYAAHKFGAKAVIVMPTTTPLIKVERTKSYGADVILKGDVYDEACAYALELAEKEGYTFIHPFDDPAVATGQGYDCYGNRTGASSCRRYPGADRRRRTRNGRLHFGENAQSTNQSYRR